MVSSLLYNRSLSKQINRRILTTDHINQVQLETSSYCLQLCRKNLQPLTEVSRNSDYTKSLNTLKIITNSFCLDYYLEEDTLLTIKQIFWEDPNLTCLKSEMSTLLNGIALLNYAIKIDCH